MEERNMKKVKYGFIKRPRINKYGAPEGFIMYKVKILSETEVYYNISYIGVVENGKTTKLSNNVTKYFQKQVIKERVFDIVEVEESWFDKILNLKIFELI